ncbi:MAG: MBL fold metallo-hydrolase [Syntrophomonas sp.]
MFEIFDYDNIICARGSREMPWKPSFQMNVYYYLIDGLLIDTGPYSLAEEAIEFFNAHSIQQVFLSHIHEDHAGMAYWLQENKQVPIYLHESSLEDALREPELAAYRLDIWGRRQAFKAEPTTNAIKTGSYIFDVIDSPGHYRNHQVLHVKTKGWLFSGDLLNNLRPKSVMFDENMSEMVLSIRNILDLDFTTVFCTHTGIRKNGKELFINKLNYLLKLQDNIRVLRNRGFTDTEIDQQLFPGPDSIGSLSGGEFSSYYIVSTL